MLYPKSSLSIVIVALFWLGCSLPETANPALSPSPSQPEAPTIQVLVNQAPFSKIEVPKEGDSWSLMSILPEGLPPQTKWLRLRISNAKTHHTVAQAATAFEQSMTVMVSEKDGALRIDFFDILTAGGKRTMAAKPHRALLNPVSIEVVTVEPEIKIEWPRLRVEVAGQGKGRLEEASVADIPQTKNPFKPMHDGGWTVRQIVALYTDDFTGVELKREAKTVKLTRAQVDGSATMLLRATKKGFWVFKRWEAGNTAEPDETVRQITELHIK